MYLQKDDSIVRSCQFSFVTPTQSICVKSDQRDLSYMLGQVEEPPDKVPPRTAGRTVFLTLNATAEKLPIAVHNSVKSELERLFAFVAGRGKRRMAVLWRRPHQFPTALNLTDAVVSLVDGSADLAAHIDTALRQQRRNAVHDLISKGFRVKSDPIPRTTAVPERIGLSTADKRVERASDGRLLAFSFMSGAVAIEEVLKDVVDEIRTGARMKAIRQRRRRVSHRYWASAQSLIDQRHLEYAGRVIAHPSDLAKWPAYAQDTLGKALGRAIAHEVRHQIVGEAHATIDWGQRAPKL